MSLCRTFLDRQSRLSYRRVTLGLLLVGLASVGWLLGHMTEHTWAILVGWLYLIYLGGDAAEKMMASTGRLLESAAGLVAAWRGGVH
ncbi:MAG: hypothetical protein ABIJ75_10275 [Actinomycetota bacterium]